MRTRPTRRGREALTLVEVLVVLAIVGVLLGALLSWMTKAKVRASSACCNCHLKQIGLAFRIYANDHGNEFPWRTPATNGGTDGFAESPQVFRHFEIASNELSTPKILTCPKDKARFVVTDFTRFGNANLSYFVGITATEHEPQMLLSGDRNLTGGSLSNGFMMTLTQTSIAAWTRDLHESFGNVGLADGSAQQLTSVGLRRQITNSLQSMPVMRLAIP